MSLCCPPRLSAILWLVAALCPSVCCGQTDGDVLEQIAAEVAAARTALPEHPKFKKYYEHLAANPDTLPVNGPKLAALLAAEAKTSAAIKDHAPSLLATWQEAAQAQQDLLDAVTFADLVEQVRGRTEDMYYI